jgi:hypothetical protein
MDPELREQVTQRAGGRRQAVSSVELLRVLPTAAGARGGVALPRRAHRRAAARRHRRNGNSRAGLLLVQCHQGAESRPIDPDSGALTRLFDPRRGRWDEHFRRDGVAIAGQPDVGISEYRPHQLPDADRPSDLRTGRMRRAKLASRLGVRSHSQTRSTRQPARRRKRVVAKSRILFPVSFGPQYSGREAGNRKCRGQQCQKQPSTNTASFWARKTKSGLP